MRPASTNSVHRKLDAKTNPAGARQPRTPRSRPRVELIRRVHALVSAPLKDESENGEDLPAPSDMRPRTKSRACRQARPAARAQRSHARVSRARRAVSLALHLDVPGGQPGVGFSFV
jgi:hypothetical protein